METKDDRVQKLEEIAKQIRRDIIDIAYKAQGPSHPGSALSITDIVTVLFFHAMRINVNEPRWDDRDRFILSKGHACPVLYAALARKGYFDPKELISIRRINSRLQGHPDMNKTPGVDFTSGSLGCGLSVGYGMALAGKLNEKSYKVFVGIGDGELQEGMVWEAVMSASAKKLDNLVAIIDNNHFQSCGSTDEISCMESISKKFEAFNWNVIDVDGHDISDIMEKIEISKQISDKPTAIIAHTVKGKGVSFMENNNAWHQNIPTEEQYLQAARELE